MLSLRSRGPWLALAFASLAGSPALAEETLLICDPELREEATRALLRAGFPPVAREPAPEVPSVAAEELRQAEQAYGQMQVTTALAHLTRARAEVERTAAQQTAPADLVRLELLEAMVRHSAGDAEQVDASLRRALVIMPALAVDPVEYPPWLRARLASLETEPASLARLEARGETTAVLWLDGARACQLPCSRELPAGSHRLRIEQDGRVPLVASRVLQAGANLIEVDLPPDPVALAGTARREIAAGHAPRTALASYPGVVRIARTARPDGGVELEVTLFGRDAGRRSTRATVRDPSLVATDAALARLLDELVRPTVAARPVVARVVPARPPPTRPWWQSPWFWAAGAAAVAGGVALVFAASGSEQGFVTVVDVPQ